MKNYFYNKDVICSNCNERAHVLAQCTKPITSYGIIAFKHVNSPEDEYMDKSHGVSKILRGINQTVLPVQFPRIKILLIQRKDTMAFSDVIRGKYSKNCLENYFSEMTVDEQRRLQLSNFEELWNSIWINPKSRTFRNEFENSKQKFESNDISKLIEMYPAQYTFSEFSVPKGRKNISEAEVYCAMREFNEETGYKTKDYNLLDVNKFRIVEEFTGSDGIDYRHIYFLAEMKKYAYKPTLDIYNRHQMEEVGGIGFFDRSELDIILRPYDIEKKKVLHTVFDIIEKF